MAHVNWRTIAFWTALWWFIYSAPTEDFFARALLTGSAAQTAEQMEGFDIFTDAPERLTHAGG